MPGIPLVARETSSYGRSADEMCREDGRGGGGGGLHLSAEEEVAAEESLSVYCKPVELYNILQRRALRNPLFLQRCLSYKIQAKRKRRIQLTISLSMNVNGGAQGHGLFPLYILLGRLMSDIGVAEHSAVYHFNRASILTNFTGVEGSNQQANFLLPELHKLALEAKPGSLALLIVSFAGAQSSSHGIDLTRGLWENVGGCCLLGKIPLESLYGLWERSPNFSLGQRVELTYPVNINSCFLKLNCFKEDKRVLIQFPHDSGNVNTPLQVQFNVSAEEVGVKEKSPYHFYTCNCNSAPLSHIVWLRAGNVIFNYRYYNNKMQKTEVTEDFSCPFCLVKCASFKGLRYHLPSSHDLFNFEFWVTDEFQAVNISVKTDSWRSEIVADGVDPKQQTFCFCSKKRRCKSARKHVQSAKHVHPHILQSNPQMGIRELLDKADGWKDSRNDMGAAECSEYVPSNLNFAGVLGSAAQACLDADYGQSVSGNNFQPTAMLPFAKTRKLSIERSDLRRTHLHKRQFFHSHRAQPMAIEQVLSDRDSEDEVDDDVADFEDRRMLDDFVDVTKDEKQMMHLWNSFVRKQRVLADGHIPWACEAFSRLHGPDLVQAPPLLWCWRLFMIKLWNHGLLDARTVNNCNIILEQFQKQQQQQETDPKKS